MNITPIHKDSALYSKSKTCYLDYPPDDLVNGIRAEIIAASTKAAKEIIANAEELAKKIELPYVQKIIANETEENLQLYYREWNEAFISTTIDIEAKEYLLYFSFSFENDSSEEIAYTLSFRDLFKGTMDDNSKDELKALADELRRIADMLCR